MSIEQDAKAAAIAAHPTDVIREGDARASRIPYANGYIRGFADGQRKASAHLAEIADAEVDAAARALNPEAWKLYDAEGVDGGLELFVHHAREQARAALEAARIAQR